MKDAHRITQREAARAAVMVQTSARIRSDTDPRTRTWEQLQRDVRATGPLLERARKGRWA